MRRIVVSFTALAALMAVSACSDQSQQTGGVSGSGTSLGAQQPRGPVGQGALTEAERLAQLQREFQTSVGDRVYFGTDSVSLNAESKQTLDRQAAFLRRYPTISLRIEGHADERGTREYNLALGDRRAQSAREYLVAQGISSSRLSTTTYGKERPEAIGASETAWSKNRRAVSVIAQ
jgi:peptidoglycan-associated lipoprotein